MNLHTTNIIDRRKDYYKYPQFVFGYDVPATGSGNERDLHLFDSIFNYSDSENCLIPFVESDEWLSDFFLDGETIDNTTIFANYFIRKNRNKIMNYLPYINNGYFYNSKIYDFTEDYSLWWQEMYNNMGLDIINLINNNRRKYKRLYELLMTDYNPLWNVDGSEVRELTHEGENTNTNTNTITGMNISKDSFNNFLKTNSKTINDLLVKSGVETDTRTLNLETAYIGTENNTRSGSEENQKSNTTFNSDTDYDTEKNVTTYNNVKDSKTFTNRSDANTGTDTMQRGFTNRNDERDITETETEGYSGEKQNTLTESRTDANNSSGEDSYTNNETLTRQGNIGVTSSQNLYNQELELLGKIVLYDELSKDIEREFLINIKGV